MKYIRINKKDLLAKDVFFAILIFITPFLYYLYRLTPDDERYYKILFFTIDAGDFEDVKSYLFHFSIKAYLILLLAIWFLTCKHWWRYVILIPLIIELYKLTSLLNESVSKTDEIEYIQSLPVIIPIILLLLFLSNRISYFSFSKILYESINKEINKQLEKLNEDVDFKLYKKDFDMLKLKKREINKGEYLKQLIDLRNRIIGN